VIGLEPGQAARRILIVEDNWANRRLLLQLLETVGFEVREAENGEEALEMWEEWSPHLIFMDMRMPVMDGYEATRRIRATTKGQAVVIVALTASALEEDRAVILSEGCDAFVRKPFREADLFGVMANHLGVGFEYQEQLPVGLLPGRDLPRDGGEMASGVRAETALPDELVAELEEATVQADLERIEAAIDAIRTVDDALADTLAGLSRDFDHDGILRVIQSWKEADNGGEEKDEGSSVRHS
jgi:CheY-like chemotaxis protein